jgi:hypothetical protein
MPILQVSVDWARDVGQSLAKASWGGLEALQSVLPASRAVQLLEAAYTVLKQEPSVLDVRSLSAACMHSSNSVLAAPQRDIRY